MKVSRMQLPKNSLPKFVQKGKLSLLVLVPHQDDEINLAGSIIRIWRQSGCQVTVAFMTNGDSVAGIEPDTRIREAVASLQVLGVSRENLIFLGYGECLHRKQDDLYINGRNVQLTSLSGHAETYGVGGMQDYHWQKYGCHSPYTYQALVSDIRDCLLEVRADVVMSVDWDVHHDHRLLSIAFEEAMGQILVRPNNTYTPLVYKGFAYGTAYYATSDFFQLNIASTKRPMSDPEYGDVFETHNPIYKWENRVRFPVPQDCLQSDLEKNNQYLALKQHASQHAIEHAERIINADKVFWQRRTDSIAYQADFTVSSGDAVPLHDFCILYPRDIMPIWTDFRSRAWRPAKEDKEKKLRVTFNEKQLVQQIVFYTDVVENPGFGQVTVKLSNGEKYLYRNIKPWGRENIINLSNPTKIDWVELYLEECDGEEPGLTELEIFPVCLSEQLPILKIMVDEEFAYTWYLRAGSNLEFKAYGGEGGVRWHLLEGTGCHLCDNILETKKDFTSAVIYCQNDILGTFDQIIVLGMSWKSIQKKKLQLQLMKARLIMRNFVRFPRRFARQQVKLICKQIGMYMWLRKVMRRNN